MVESDSAYVTFRITREAADGAVTTEEREVRCRPDELARCLAEPWETVGGEPGTRPDTDRLELAARRALESMELVVRKGREPDGTRTWRVGFRSTSPDGPPSTEEGAPEVAPKEERAPEEGAPQQERGPGDDRRPEDVVGRSAADPDASLVGRAAFHLGDDGEGEATIDRGGGRIHVIHQGLSVVDLGVYAVLALNMTLHLHEAPGDGPTEG